MSEYIYHLSIPKMSCSVCAESIKTALDGINGDGINGTGIKEAGSKGVREISFNLSSRTIKVRTESEIEQIISVIDSAGYAGALLLGSVSLDKVVE